MARFLLVLPFLVIAFDVFSIVDVALTDVRRVRALNKWIWILLILVLPVIGGVLWFVIGKARQQDSGGDRRQVAPDDDPAFLKRLERDEETDARIRLLEEQLAELDDDDPKK
jgi:hypothetical protein